MNDIAQFPTISYTATNNEAIKLINARKFHEILDTDYSFDSWVDNCVDGYDVVDGYDFILHFTKDSSGNILCGCYISFATAKDVCMWEQNIKEKLALSSLISIYKDSFDGIIRADTYSKIRSIRDNDMPCLNTDDYCYLTNAIISASVAVFTAGKSSKRSSLVYFIQCNSTKNIKIGKSINVHERMKQIKGMTPSGIDLLATIDGDTDVEANLHKKFNKYSVHGEWFKPSRELMDFIKSIQDDAEEMEMG